MYCFEISPVVIKLTMLNILQVKNLSFDKGYNVLIYSYLYD